MRPVKKRTTDIINTIIHNAETNDNVTIGEFIHTLGERVFGLAVLLFALPNSLPLPGIPGFSSITGAPIIIFGLQMMLGQRTPWLPQKISSYRFSQKKLAFILKKTIPILRKIEFFVKPRFSFMLSPLAERFIGLAFMILGWILAMPIPFGNFLPGISLCIIALGLVEGDGLVIIMGIIAGIMATSIISTAIIVLVKSLLSSIHYFV